MVVKKRGLGRGLDALLGADARTAKAEPEDVSGKLQEVPIEWIQPGKYQPEKSLKMKRFKSWLLQLKLRASCSR